MDSKVSKRKCKQWEVGGRVRAGVEGGPLEVSKV